MIIKHNSLFCIAAMLVVASPSMAQYPLTPSAVIDPSALTPTPRLSGYFSVRQARKEDSTSIAVNRARLTMTDAPLPWAALRIQGDFSATGRTAKDSTVSAFVLTDAYAQIFAPSSDSASLAHRLAATLIAGQFKTPFSLEYQTSFSLLRTANRSLAVDKLSPRRDIGAMGQIRPMKQLIVSAALLNGEGSNATRNPDNNEMGIARVTVLPLAHLALAGKILNQGGDHGWGYDGRFFWRRLDLEGEAIHRRRYASAATTAFDGSGGYALAALKVLPWAEPVVKWEQYREGIAAQTSATWTTAGVNFESGKESLRLLVDYISKTEHPVESKNNELDVQLVVIF